MKKSEIQIQEIPDLIKKGKLSSKEAVKLISIDLVKNKKNYFLITEDEDVLNELVLRFLQTGAMILKNYNSNLCNFKTYLSSIFRYQTLSILKEQKKINKNERILETQQNLHYENDMNKYENDEFPFKIAHVNKFTGKKNSDFVSEKNLKRRIVRKIPQNPSKPSLKSFMNYWNTKASKSAKTTLILALKSSYYMTEENIETVCDYCEISRKLMEETIRELKESVEDKQSKRERLQNYRDKSFNMHIKYQTELFENTDPKKRQELLEKYRLHTENWHKRNHKLQDEHSKVCPTNKQLAEILGIGERQVANYIHNAEKLVESIKAELSDSDNS